MASTQVHRCQHKIQITITKTNVLNSRTALPWKIYWQHGFYQRKYFMSWWQYWELWYYPFSVFQKWSPPSPCLSTTKGGGCPSTTCLVCTAFRSIHTLQWEKVPHYGSLEAKGGVIISPKVCVCVCVCVCFRSPEFTSTWNWESEGWKDEGAHLGVWGSNLTPCDIIYKSPKVQSHRT